MKIGDYVRYKYSFTNNGVIDCVGIDKITKINEFNAYYLSNMKYDNLYITDYFVIKSNPDILKIIEPNDYVNGELIEDIEDDVLLTKAITSAGIDGRYIYREDIKTIVTKEQFEKIEYKVGE